MKLIRTKIPHRYILSDLRTETNLSKTITVDLITKLPNSKGHDSILTVIDQGATKAVILLPGSEAMGAVES